MALSTVCVIVKNEAHAVAEWVAFQRAIGFDRVCVYDNGSTDATAAIVAKIARRDSAVTYTAWPDMPGRVPQITAYEDALGKCSTDWLAFFDVDEFLVLHKHPDVNAFLSAAPAGLTAVACNWKVFGSGGAIASSNELVISRFRRCARTSHPKNRFCKSIVQPAAVKTIRVHTVELSHGAYGDSSWRSITLPSDAKTASVCHSGAQLNHYLLKSWEEFERKRLRGNAARAPEARDKYSHRGTAARPPQSRREKRDPAHDYWVKHDLNMRYDASALRWLPQVISRLQEWDLLEDRWTAVAARPRIGLGRSLWRRLVARPLA